MNLVIATKNKNKLLEIKNKFSSISDLNIISIAEIGPTPDVIEDGSTFEENAQKKAIEISKYTDYPVLGDDSGLMIDALDGRPGIYSARYGGKEISDSKRNQLILEEMQGIKIEKRNAKFVCAISIVFPGSKKHSFQGECHGLISKSMTGKHGFGYDPIFFLPEQNKTMAEISLKVKNKISHRAIALDKAKNILEKILCE